MVGFAPGELTVFIHKARMGGSNPCGEIFLEHSDVDVMSKIDFGRPVYAVDWSTP